MQYANPLESNAKKYPMPLKSDWLDSEEEEKDTNEQNIEEEIEDWEGNLQKQKDLKEQELNCNNNKTSNKAQDAHPHQTLMIQKYSPHSSLTL